MHKLVMSATLVLLLAFCTQKQVEENTYQRWVGDISFDPKTDNPDFKLCYSDQEIVQYFNFAEGVRYKGEKPAIDAHFFENYQEVPSDKAGLIRIRFIVNCQGETGRFRVQSMNWNYEPMEFEPAIRKQLLQLTKELNGWLPIQMEEMDNKALDYYQYLIFKIDEGKLIEIMP